MGTPCEAIRSVVALGILESPECIAKASVKPLPNFLGQQTNSLFFRRWRKKRKRPCGKFRNSWIMRLSDCSTIYDQSAENNPCVQHPLHRLTRGSRIHSLKGPSAGGHLLTTMPDLSASLADLAPSTGSGSPEQHTWVSSSIPIRLPGSGATGSILTTNSQPYS
jgi:hypothetical protein